MTAAATHFVVEWTQPFLRRGDAFEYGLAEQESAECSIVESCDRCSQHWIAFRR
jgi:hypothetical protein